MDSTLPTLDCPDHGIRAYSLDSTTHLSSAMRAEEETTFKSKREGGTHCSEPPAWDLKGLRSKRPMLAAPRTCWDHPGGASRVTSVRDVSAVGETAGCSSGTCAVTVNMDVGRCQESLRDCGGALVPEVTVGQGSPVGFIVRTQVFV